MISATHVILCGGSGIRLWLLCRPHNPPGPSELPINSPPEGSRTGWSVALWLPAWDIRDSTGDGRNREPKEGKPAVMTEVLGVTDSLRPPRRVQDTYGRAQS